MRWAAGTPRALRREPKRAVNSGRDPRGEDEVAVDDDPLVHRDCAEERQEVERRPVCGRPPAAQKPSRAAKKRAGADGKDFLRACRLAPQPAEHLLVIHESLLAASAGNVEDVELRRFRKRRVRHDAEPHHVARGRERLRVNPVRRVGHTREHLERTGQVDLVKVIEQQRPDLQVNGFGKHAIRLLQESEPPWRLKAARRASGTTGSSGGSAMASA